MFLGRIFRRFGCFLVRKTFCETSCTKNTKKRPKMRYISQNLMRI